MSEMVSMTIEDFRGLALGENEGVPDVWLPGEIILNEATGADRYYTNHLGYPLIELPTDGINGPKTFDLHFINKTTFRVEYTETAVRGVGNNFIFYLINDETQERVTLKAMGGGYNPPYGNTLLRKYLYFAVQNNALLGPGHLPAPSFGIISSASLRQSPLRDNDQWSDFSYIIFDTVPDWFLEGNTKPDYPGDESDTGGGTGSYIGRNDVIGIPDFPSISALGTGFINAYNPNDEPGVDNLERFSDWLWSSDFSTNVKKNQASPFDNIISFGFVPLGDRLVTGYDTIHIGNFDTEISCKEILREYYEINSGWLNIYEYWGSFLDYQADYQIYLPYIGYQPIRASEFVDGMIRVVYHVSCITGMLQCYVQCQKNGIPHILYSFCGNCYTDLPYNGANYLRMKLQLQQSVYNGVTGAIQGAINGAAAGGPVGAVGGLIGGAISGAKDYAMTKASARPDYQHGGGLSGNGGMFAIRYPYLIETKSITQVPGHYKSQVGVPSMINRTIGQLSGYTEIYSINTSGLSLTDGEIEELRAVLKGGVYL